MLELVRASVCPKPEMVAVVNAGLETLCTHIRYPADKTRRLQLATEEIFLYALNTIHKASLRSILTVRFRSHANGFQIVVEYVGPRGELDGYLKPGQLQSLKVNGFDAVGLCLAANVLDYLKSTYWTVEGINCYLLSQNFPCTLTYST